MLRKMVFGPRGRLSTDLDFTLRSQIARDDLMMELLESFGQSYRGLRFQLDQSNDWYLADESCGANPRVVEGYRFLSNLTELESTLASDKAGKAQAEADQLTQELCPTPRVL